MGSPLLPVLSPTWIDQDVHDLALAGLLASRRRSISLVDWVSFEIARRAHARDVFGFDRHFVAEGFTLLAN